MGRRTHTQWSGCVSSQRVCKPFVILLWGCLAGRCLAFWILMRLIVHKVSLYLVVVICLCFQELMTTKFEMSKLD